MAAMSKFLNWIGIETDRDEYPEEYGNVGMLEPAEEHESRYSGKKRRESKVVPIHATTQLKLVVISPATKTMPVVVTVSHATRAVGSCSKMASSTASDIWSHILSGCPSVTDSDVNRCI